MSIPANTSPSRQHRFRRSGGGAAVTTAAVSAALLTMQPAPGQLPIFSDYVVLGQDDPRVRGGEPSLQISIRGNLWSTDVGSPPVVWKSVDGGATWTPLPLPISIGGADRDAAEDEEGRLHVVDQTDGRNDCIFIDPFDPLKSQCLTESIVNDSMLGRVSPMPGLGCCKLFPLAPSA